MNYLQIIDLIFVTIMIIFGLMTLHFLVFSIIGVFAKKKFPKAKVKHKYGIIIPARNEEPVVGGLIQSVYKKDRKSVV